MRCEEVLSQLSAWCDSELQAEDAAVMDVHLAQCAACRATANGLKSVNDELRQAFVPQRAAAVRLAENVAASICATATLPTPTVTQRLSWVQALTAMAAGFLLAVILFRPWQLESNESVIQSAPEPVGRLALASGPVEMRWESQVEFYRCPTSAPIGKDSTVRTGPSARCEIALDDGNAVRLDNNTEVTLRDADAVEVNRGRLWSASTPGRESLAVQSGGGTFVPKEAAEFALTCESRGAQLTVVDGEVDVETAGETVTVGAGRKVWVVDGKVEDDPDWHDALLETVWVNSVLALDETEHPELVERLNRLLANVGAAKLSLLYEDELRRLGDDGVPPLLAYLKSTRETPDIAQRATAARIAADVAESRWIGDLIDLLGDRNAEVRYHAARGLERLSGRDQGCDAGTWRNGPSISCESALRRWVEWWEVNRERYRQGERDGVGSQENPL